MATGWGEITSEAYSVEGYNALMFDAGDDERLYVEAYGDRFSIAWTTALSSTTLEDRIHQPLQRQEQSGEPGASWILTTADRETEPSELGSLDEFFVALTECDDRLAFWRVDLHDRAVTWERDASPPARGHGLMGFIGAVLSEEDLLPFIAATATPTIGYRLGELIHKGAELVSATQESRPAVE